MKTLIVRNKSFNKFLKDLKPEFKKVDLVLMDFNAFDKIYYQKEIEGKTSYITRTVEASKKLDCVFIVGIHCNLFGKDYCSTLVVDSGDILGIADSVYTKKFDKGKEFKIFKTKLGKIGVVVSEDIINNNSTGIIKSYGADFIINICDELDITKVNNKIFEVGSGFNISIINLNVNSYIFYKKKGKQNKIGFESYSLKHFKI